MPRPASAAAIAASPLFTVNRGSTRTQLAGRPEAPVVGRVETLECNDVVRRKVVRPFSVFRDASNTPGLPPGRG